VRLALAPLAIAVLMACTPVVRAEAPDTPADRADLTDLYPSEAAWQADAARLQAQRPDLLRCKGHLGDSALRLRQCLDLQADMGKRLARLAVYASELLAHDTGVSSSLSLSQKTDLLASELDEAGAFVAPEIVRLGAAKVQRFLAQDKGLQVHRHPLQRILRTAAHRLDDRGEALVAGFGNLNGVGASAYTQLAEADLPWPTLKLSTGETVTLDQAGYSRWRESAVREDRQRVMAAFFGALKTYERTLGVLMYSQLKQDAVYTKLRKYPDSATRVLDEQGVPVKVLDTLIAQTNANLPTLHRYFRLRARMLGLSDMVYADIYPPLVQGDYRFPLATGKQLAVEAVAPLGSAYQQAFAKGLDSRWMDTYPRPRKQSGAHMIGIAVDVHPYVLMNYNDSYESVSTLAHEWGHAMHSYLANQAQPFVTSNYGTFVAEIASTFNEALLLERMLKAARSDEERLFYLGNALENLRATFYRQTMFAEFEREVHGAVDAGEPMTGEQLSQRYCKLLRRYHGADQGVVAIGDGQCIEWAYIPHFYDPYYVYQYATSVAASALLADQVSAKEPGALDRYLNLLRAGGSNDPYLLVKAAGVDMATPAPYQALVARMNRIMDEIEALLATRAAAAKAG
jgi:oligoendopeptidase F